MSKRLPSKYLRLVQLEIQRNGAEILTQSMGGAGHYKFTIKLPSGDIRHISVSCTPTIPEVSINNAGRDVKRLCANARTEVSS